MRIFLSYSRADAAIAEQITVNLKQAGHDVFFDKYGIEVAEDFNRVIWKEIQKTALFIFLISPNSVKNGSYALTELSLAEKRWPNPERRVLAVVVETTDYATIPVYATLCHILHPKGNAVSEVREKVNALYSKHRLRRLGQITVIAAGLALTGSLLAFGYREFLEQRPLAARERLVAMNLFSTEAFIETAFKGDKKLMELYLTAGMDPNATKEDNTTALMSAVQGKHVEIVKILIESGANVNTGRSWTYNTALDDAATSGQEESLRMLLAAGADNDTVDRALVNSAKGENMKNFHLLLNHGVSQAAIDSAFIVSVVNGNLALMHALSDKITNPPQSASEALLEIARAAKNEFLKIPDAVQTKTLKFLIDLGADVGARNKDGFTPLGLAVSNQNVKLAKFLLTNNAVLDTHRKCTSHSAISWTPLTDAIYTKVSSSSRNERADADLLIALLLENGADVNLARAACPREEDTHNARPIVAYDETPLMLAATGDDLQLVGKLLENGANINDQNSQGYTALSYAAGNKSMLAELLANGADIHAGRNPLLHAIENKSYHGVETLLKAGADANKEDSEGNTPLMLAAATANVEMLTLLLKAGADVNKSNNKGTTPLMSAAYATRPDMLLLLLKAGARTTDKDSMGRTAEMIARQKHADEIVALLQNTER